MLYIQCNLENYSENSNFYNTCSYFASDFSASEKHVETEKLGMSPGLEGSEVQGLEESQKPLFVLNAFGCPDRFTSYLGEGMTCA